MDAGWQAGHDDIVAGNLSQCIFYTLTIIPIEYHLEAAASRDDAQIQATVYLVLMCGLLSMATAVFVADSLNL